MKTFRTTVRGVIAGSLLLGVSSGLISAQTPASNITEAPAPSSVAVAGHFCVDLAHGQVWVADGTQVVGTECVPTPATGGGIFLPAAPTE